MTSLDALRPSIAVLLTLAACGGSRPPGAPSNRGDVAAAPAASCELPPRPPLGISASGICTDMGCTDGYRVSLSTARWQPGTYTFELTADGKHQTCTGAIPLAECGELTLRCTGDEVASIGEISCGGPVELMEFDEIAFNGTPCSAGIVIKRDGTTIADQVFTPGYGWITVNGPGCGPQCLQAHDEILLD